MEAPITPTCKLCLAILAAGAAQSGLAAPVSESERLSTYVAARAADAGGDSSSASRLYASLIRGEAGEAALRQRAVSEAIEAGDMALALSLSSNLAAEQTPLDLRMLRVADDLRAGRSRQALATLGTKGGLIDTNFMLPFVEAWVRADARDQKAADSLDVVARGSALANQVDEHRAMILLKLKRLAEALPLAEKALAGAGGRADRLRLAFADGFATAGDKANAAKFLEGGGPTLAVARALLRSGKPLRQRVDNAGDAFGELMLGLSLALNRLQDKSLPISLAQVARYANPDNGANDLLLGLLLDGADRTEPALVALRRVKPGDPFASPAQDAISRILSTDIRNDEALRYTSDLVTRQPSADAYSRYGAVLVKMGRNREGADAYAKAIELAGDGAGSDEQWMLRLYRAGALQDDGRWPEAKVEVTRAMEQSPDNALLLNFLGYGMLEAGEQLNDAEAMVRKAAALRPDDASITDSLGWAEYKMGKVDEAIRTLQRAAEGDPEQSEIREHLGDALFTAGRRIEARFAWRAALVNEEDAKARQRLLSKLDVGLTKANAAP